MRISLSLVWAASLVVVLSPIALADAAEKTFEAIEYQRRTIYHSPDTPGYTCWVYAWLMPDESIMVSFFQATGPMESQSRAPDDVQRKLSWPHLFDPHRDMTGRNACIVYLQSTDGGETWQKVSENAFNTPMSALINGSTGLRDGAIVRTPFGPYLPYDADVPKTGLVQRSTDGAKTWSKLAPLLSPTEFTVWPVGVRQLRNGRVAVLGGVSRMPCDRAWSEYAEIMDPLLIVSDDGGKTWGLPISVIPEEDRKGWACEECDMAELPNGDLFWVFRRCAPEDIDKPLDQRRHTYWQGTMEKHGDTWKPNSVGPSPFPNMGLPNLMATREGMILLVNAGQWTADAGNTWHPVNNLPARAYYPKGIQLANGRILVFAHVGSDDPYGAVDQKILMDSYRLLAR